MKPKAAILFSVCILALLVVPATVQADGLDNNEVQFTGRITSVIINGSATGTLFVRLDTFDLRVLVNARTAIEDSDDDPTTIERLASMAATAEVDVEVNGKFSSAGILASKIRVLEPQTLNRFELHGHITGIQRSGTGFIVSLLGIRITVSSETTDVLWDGAEINASDLEVGMFVHVVGTISPEAVWTAGTVKVLSQGRKRECLRFEGTVLSWDSAQGILVVEVAGATANQTTVLVTSSTRIEGVLAVGAYVRVTGTLNSTLGVTATEIEVVPPLELKPDERKLRIGEIAVFTVKMRVAATEPVTVALAADPAGVLALPAAPVVIPVGMKTADFTVQALTAGVTTLTASVGPVSATAEVTVGEISGDDEDDPTREVHVKFAPDHIKLKVGDTREVVLIVQPPQKGTVQVTFTTSNDKVEVVSDRVLSNGAAVLKVLIRGLAEGTSSVIATLPEGLGGGTTELLVEVGAGRGNDTSVNALDLEFRPASATMKVDETRIVEVWLGRPVVDAVRIPLRQDGNALEVPSAVEVPAGRQSGTFRIRAKSQGHSRVSANLPSSLGGKSARFEADVRK